MTCETAHDLIDDLVDGRLEPAARETLDAHLATCALCASLAEDLLVVRRAARSLPVIEPPERAWTAIAHSTTIPGPVVPASRPWRQWVGVPLAVAAVLLAAVAITFVVRQSRAQDAAGTTAASATLPATPASSPQAAANAADLSSLEAELQQAEAHYENAIQKLEVLARDRRTLEPKDAAILQKNLMLIDGAIGESRAALRAQPASELAQESLFEAFHSKITLLQDTIALVNEMRKGNQAEAAHIADGLHKS